MKKTGNDDGLDIYYNYEVKEEELVLLLKVLDDMYSDYSIISSSARSYYYEHYATEEERDAMDKEDIRSDIIFKVFSVILISLIISAIVISIIKE